MSEEKTEVQHDATNRGAFLARIVEVAQSLKIERVTIENFGDVLIQELNGQAREKYEAFVYSATKTNKFTGMRPLLISFSVVDSDSKLIFIKGNEKSQIGLLPGRVVEDLFDACLKLNGMDVESQEALEEDFTDPQIGSSGTG